MRVTRKMLGSVCCMAIVLVFLLSGMTVYAEDGVGVWTGKAPMSIARDGHKLAVINGEIYTIGGNDGNGPLNLVEEYEPGSNTWTTKVPMPSKRSLHQVTVVNNKIYVIGGCDEKGIIGTVEEFDPSTDTWTTKASMNVKRCDVRVAVINEKIYAIGGDDGTSYSNVVEEYDPATDTWTTKAPMSVKRSDHQLAVINGLIYVIGGNDGESYFLDSVEAYNPATDTWSEKAPMQIRRQSHVVAITNGKIYAIGGNTPSGVTNSAEEYNPATNEWKAIASMAEKRYYHQVAVVEGRIYAIGGCDGINYLDSVELYVPAVNSWIKVASLPESRGRHEVALSIYGLFVVGGSNSQLLNTMVGYCPNPAPWAPANLTTIAEKGGINLSWQAVTGSAIYNIMRSTTEGGIYTSIATSPSISYTDTSVTDGNTYYYRVSAINDGGEGYKSNVASALLLKSPVSLGVASVDKAAPGDVITADIVINNAVNICAEDVKITYDTAKLELISADGADGIKIFKEDNLTEGIRRYISASLGKSNAANGDKILLKLTFKVKAAGSAKIDIVSGRIADNATLEEDLAQADCGEKTILIEERIKDVDRSGKFTLLDLAIDAWYYGEDVASTDTSKYDADVIVNGKIDDDDLTEIVRMITESQTVES